MLKDAKIVGPSFPNSVEIVRVVYDFAQDGGAVGNLTALTASDTMTVKLRHFHVITAVTAAGAIEVSLGKGTSGTEFMNGVLKAALGVNVVTASASVVRLVKDEIINLNIAEDAATAGKIEFVFEVCKSN